MSFLHDINKRIFPQRLETTTTGEPPPQQDARGILGVGPGKGPGGMLDPEQSAAARNVEIEQGRARWREMMNDPQIIDIINRRKDMSQGLNAQEMTAARDQMARGLQGQQTAAMRSLYAQQAKSGVRGGMAGAQQARLQRQLASDRAGQEQKMLLDNYALKRQGLGDYQDIQMRQKFGELSQGLGEAGLGVSDRTGYMQGQIGQKMAEAAQNQKKSNIWDFFGLT